MSAGSPGIRFNAAFVSVVAAVSRIEPGGYAISMISLGSCRAAGRRHCRRRFGPTKFVRLFEPNGRAGEPTRMTQTGGTFMPDARGAAGANDTTEQRLLAAVVQRDESALEQLYRAYHTRLSRFVVRLCGSYSVAEEVINDTFFTVWKGAAEFRGQSRVSTWIMGIAYRYTLKALERSTTRRDRESEAAEIELVGGSHENPLESHMVTRQWLSRALARLPADQRLALELAHLLGHSCAEIAVIADCPVGTVKTRLFHARRRMQAELAALDSSRPAAPGDNP
jgi:RNA polymerase sigma-70 factor, ECF subfamily